MPVLSALFASADEATTTSGTFVNAAVTSALLSGVTYLVIATSTILAPSSNSTENEVEAEYAGTRYAFSNFVGPTSFAPDSATGGTLQTFFTVTGNGTDGAAVRFRRVSGGGTTTATVRIVAIPLASLTLNTHYWLAEVNGDTVTTPTAGSAWTDGASSVTFTAPTTGDYLVMGTMEVELAGGGTSNDFSWMRFRQVSDVGGSDTGSNVMASAANAGPETRREGGESFDLTYSQRFKDVVSLTSGTQYSFAMQYQGSASAANSGYRRERVLVLDLSVWDEFFYFRDEDGESGQLDTFGNATSTAPSEALDYVLLSAVTHNNGNSFIRVYFDLDPTGSGTQNPDPGFGFGVGDVGVSTIDDDYVLVPVQEQVLAETGALTVGVECVADNNNCRWGVAHAVFPGGADNLNGVSTPIIIWGMSTTTADPSPSGDMDGSAAGAATTGDADLDGSGALAGSTSAAATTGDADLTGTSSMAGSANGQAATGGADLGGAGALGGGATAQATVDPADISASGSMSGSASGQATTALLQGLMSLTGVTAWIGNSYTQNFNSLPTLLVWHLQQLTTYSGSMGPVPHLGTSISTQTNGWFPGYTLGMMTLYDDIEVDASSGTTDALDAVDSVANDAYDTIIMTSGFRQEVRDGESGITFNDVSVADRVILPGAGGTNENLYAVNLEVARRAANQLISDGSTADIILRMTHEGFNPNDDADLADIRRTRRLQVLAARALMEEGVYAGVSPDAYVWGRLQQGVDPVGTAGNTPTGPVTSWVGLTHSSSAQPGNANEAPMYRTQGDTAPFNTNGHQNVMAMIIQSWIWLEWAFGIDCRGDTTFVGDPSSLPSPFNDMISPDGTQIYGGHNTGAGNVPWNANSTLVSGLDSESVYDWTQTAQFDMQDIVHAAVQDWVDLTTEYDGLVQEGAGTASGSATTGAANLSGAGAMSGSSAGAANTSPADLDSAVQGSGSAAGSATAGDASLSGSGALAGTTGGQAFTSANGSTSAGSGGSAAGAATTGDADLDGVGALAGSASGGATVVAFPLGALAGTGQGVATVDPAAMSAEAEMSGTAGGQASTSATGSTAASMSGSAQGQATVTTVPQNIPRGPFRVRIKGAKLR